MRKAAWLLVGLLGCSSAASETDLTIAKAPASRVELKVTVRAEQTSLARELLDLQDDSAERRGVTFYDTTELALFDRGVILRARDVRDGPDDSTVKIRPLAATDVDLDWFTTAGFKCEIDRTSQKSVSSCSLTVPQSGGEIRDVANDARAVKKLFSDEQEDFLAEQAGDVDWTTLVPLGPIDARVWTVHLDGVAPDVSVELWTLPDGRELLEVSTKVRAADADATENALGKSLGAFGLDVSTTQETKTKTALSYFAQAAQ